MSADESALLAAVAADPASDLPRLVYADFLDDHGQPLRAEFIRLQCEIARLEVGPRAVVDANWRLWKRQQDLLDDHLPEILGPAAFLAEDRPECRRGFVAATRLHVGRFLQVGQALAGLSPLLRLSVEKLEADIAGFFTSSHLPLVTSLHAFDLDAVASDPGLLIAEGLQQAAARLSRLEHLDLASSDVSDPLMEIIAPADFPALKSLDLANCYLSDSGVVTLLNGRFARRLQRLSLDGNPVGDQAAFELADRLAPVKTFRTLDFRRTHVTSAGQAALTAAFGSRCNLF